MIYISNDCFYSHYCKMANKQYDFPLVSGHFTRNDFITLIKNIKTIDFSKVKFYKRKKLIYCEIDRLVEWCFIHDTDFKKCKEAYFRRLRRWDNNRDDIIYVFNTFDRDYQQLSFDEIIEVTNLGVPMIVIIDNIKHYQLPSLPNVRFVISNNKSPEWYIHSKPFKYIYNNNEINAIHLAGQCQGSYTKLQNRLLACIDISAYKPNEYDIVSCWTDDSKCILYKQLSRYNIPLINAIPDDYDKSQTWYMPNKIHFIIDALKNKCTNDIVMVLDGYDVLFNSFKDVKKRFLESGYRILYNGTKYNYPKVDIGVLTNVDSDWRYFNAGCCIGYREDLIRFYEEALEYIDIENQWNSEQYILRHVFAKHTDTVMFEHNPKIFITMGLTKVHQINDTKFIIESLGYQDNPKIPVSK